MPLTKEAEYLIFIRWIATPEPLRKPTTQRELALELNVAEPTFSNWKEREGFWDEVKKELKVWGKNRTPNVVLGLYRKAIKDGNAAEAKLWLQYIEEWAEKQELSQKGETVVKFESDGIYIHSKAESKAESKKDVSLQTSSNPAPSDDGPEKVQSDPVRPAVGEDNSGSPSADSRGVGQ